MKGNGSSKPVLGRDPLSRRGGHGEDSAKRPPADEPEAEAVDAGEEAESARKGSGAGRPTEDSVGRRRRIPKGNEERERQFRETLARSLGTFEDELRDVFRDVSSEAREIRRGDSAVDSLARHLADSYDQALTRARGGRKKKRSRGARKRRDLLGEVWKRLGYDTVRDFFNRLGRRSRSFDVDPFGMDPDFRERVKPLVQLLYDWWWRIEVEGLEHVPEQGGALLVANHSGVVPYDGAMISYAVEEHHPAQRPVRFMVEEFVARMPVLSSLAVRLGGVTGRMENAERLLARGELVAVFPEGVKGLGKPFSKRYRLQRFGRGGFVRLCIRAGVPLVPVAVVGAEEIHPMLHDSRSVAELAGLPYFPISPTFPWLGPFGLIPLPTKWRIIFGEPIEFPKIDRDRLEDDAFVNRTAQRVRSAIQKMIDEALVERKSIWF